MIHCMKQDNPAIRCAWQDSAICLIDYGGHSVNGYDVHLLCRAWSILINVCNTFVHRSSTSKQSSELCLWIDLSNWWILLRKARKQWIPVAFPSDIKVTIHIQNWGVKFFFSLVGSFLHYWKGEMNLWYTLHFKIFIKIPLTIMQSLSLICEYLNPEDQNSGLEEDTYCAKNARWFLVPAKLLPHYNTHLIDCCILSQ